MSVAEQSKIFLIFFIVGIIVAFIFDIFRGFRKSFKFSNFIIYAQDIVFLGISRIIYI
jgi:hypothetical protein